MPFVNWLATAGLLLWILSEVVLRHHDSAETASWKGGQPDQGSTLLLIGSYIVSTVVAQTFRSHGVGTVPVAWRWIGVVLLAGGLVLRAWSMRILAASYTRTLRTTEGRQLITAGPYGRVRHPGYTGSLLVWTGYCLGIGSWAAMLAVGALLTATYLWRIRAEETMLVEGFGDEYRAYQRRTGRLLPPVR